MIFRSGTTTRRNRKQENQQRETRRRRLSRLMSRAPQLEPLEDRRLLATLTVTTTADVVDGNDNVLSLREAMLIANDSSGVTTFDGFNSTDVSDDIVFGSMITSSDSIVLAGTELPPVAEELFVNGLVTGGRITIDGDASSRIFNNQSDFTLFNTNLTNGSVTSSGGALVSDGTLSLSSVDVTSSEAGLFGGAIEIDGGTAQLTAIRLMNNTATQGGGIDVDDGDVTIDTFSQIDGNTAVESGGGIYVNQGSLTIRNDVDITNNVAQGDLSNDGGGGIYVFSAANLTIDGTGGTSDPRVEISGNRATGTSGSGGGIFNAGTVSINDALIGVTKAGAANPNTANRAGGGIEVTASSSTSITDTVLSNNVAGPAGSAAPGNGGGLHVTGAGDVSITGGTVNGNTASQEGGGLWNGGGTMTIDGTTINGNTAESANAAGDAQGGGGIFNNGGTINISGATIDGNTALDPDAGGTQDDGGGGIFNNGGDVTITTTTISGNTATDGLGNGGGILSLGGTLTIDGGTISGNVAARAGGGIENNDGIVTLRGVTVDGNTADINGGGLHVSGAGTTEVNGGVFQNNLAGQEGGGLWNNAGTMTINGTTIQNNTASGATADQGGGGIFNNGGTVDIDAVTIMDNTADGTSGSGGGIQNLGGTITIDNSTISGNSATRAGGGIEDNAGSSISITDSTISANNAGSAPGNGGGIHITGTGTVDIDGSTIAGNTAVEGGGIWNSGVGTFTLTNTTISSNTATGSDGGGVFNTDGGTITTDSVTITLNDASTGFGSGIAGGTGGVTIENTIVAQNPGGGDEENLSGAIASDDFNLIGDANDGTLTGLIINTIFGGDARLLPLANNGGPTETHFPASGSAAIGFGRTDLGVDQRDIVRPQGGQDDIGAVEVDLNGFIIDADEITGGQAGDGNPDEFLIINDPTGITGEVLVYVNSQLVFAEPQASTGSILIRGSSDDDTLIVDNSEGLIGAKIIFDGDGGPRNNDVGSPGGFDTLRLVGSTPADTTYNPGETADAGAIFQTDNQLTQRVEFFGLEPIQVLAPIAGNNILNVAAAPLGVGFPQALNASNSINYTEGPNSNDPVDPVFGGAITGLITVDGFESLEFANFEVLNIDAGAGSDEINLNNPVTPNELGTINVDGGDPTASSDVVVVNGTAATDTVTIDQLTADGATVTGLGPVINVTTAEHLVYDSQGGADDLFVETPTGLDQIQVFPGVNPGDGEIAITTAAGNDLLGVQFENLDSANNASTLTLRDADADRNDDLVYWGSDSIDEFSVNSGGFVLHRESFVVSSAKLFVELATPGIRNLTLVGRGGADLFTVPGDHPFDELLIDGGTPDSGSDVLNFIGSGNGAITVNLDADLIAETGARPVTYSGIELIDINANNTLTISGTPDNDTFNVTPRDAGSGLFDHSGSPGVAFEYRDATTTTFSGGTGVDELNVLGDAVADTVTSTASAITVDGSTVTLGTGLESLRVLGLGGDDDIDLSALTFAAGATILGGDGNDALTGTGQADRIFGGAGNDTLIGAAGDDFQYGEDGNDVFGNATLVADGTADDPGTDFNFGGNGFDNFVWEPGDGADFNNGGDDGADVFRFFGSAAADAFVLRPGGTPTHFNADINGTVIDNHGIEDVIVDPLGGDDTVAVNDLFTTEVVNVSVLAGGGNETISVAGRSTADDLQVTSPNQSVEIEGLTYDVNISGSDTSDNLIINANEGDDSVSVAAGVELLITSTVNGDAGNDALSGAFNTANGGTGDDTIIGDLNDQTLSGDAGEDTFVGGAGTDTIDGGDDFDTILIAGTSGDDIIDVFQAAPTTLNHTVNGTLEVDTLVLDAASNRTVEEARVVAGDGADLIRVNWLDAHGVNANVDSLRMTVEGGSDSTSDRLVVVDNATGDLTLYRKGQTDDSGTVQVGPGNAEPLLSVFSEIERVDFVGGGGGDVVVFKHDPFESNETLLTSTYLGSGDTINVDPTIDPGPVTNPFGDGQNLPGDSDFYRLVAETTGTLDFQVYFRQIATVPSGRPGLPNAGNLDINVLDAAGNVITGFGVNDADDDERVRIPAVEGQTYYLQVFGADDAINVYNFSVVNHAAPVPFDLELLDNPADGTTNPPGTSTNSDTGRSQFDNITYDDTPTLFLRLDDGILLNDLQGNVAPLTNNPPDEPISIPFQAGVAQPTDPGFAIAIFDEGNTPPQTGNPTQVPLGFATAVAGQEGIYTFTVPVGLELSEGSHFLTARVQMIDPSDPQQVAFGERSLSLEIVVDRTPPEAVFGLAAEATDGLHPDSDSGVVADNITNDLSPTFFGRAEANSIIRAFVDLDDSGTLTAGDLLIGQTTAIPLDGTDQLETPLDPNEPGGQWQLTSTVSMNDPRITAALGLDGVRRILLSAEDVAGNITAPDAVETLEIFIDTQGPQVTDVFITSVPGFNLFDLKPDTPQPTPRVDSLTISLQDLPARVAPFLYGVLANGIPPLSPIVLVGDHSGPIAIDNVAYNDINIGPGVATGEIVLSFDEPLPDDRFTLTLTDNLVDPAGNPLDGENNAAEPIGNPMFPTGDGLPGGDFIARFTVDSRPEVATWSQGVVYADINGNFVWDPEGQDNDATNRDFVYNFGEITDAYFTGNFSSVATSSGFDKVGAYGAFNGVYQFFLDTDDDGVGDLVPSMAFQVNAIPVAGNFFNSAADIAAVAAGQRPRDEIGAFDGQNWYLDVNGNNQIDAGEQFPTDLRGIPVVGDFNGDGFDDLATFNNNTGQFQFDLDRNGTVDDTLTFGFSGFGEKPIAGDFNLDGIDDIGLWVPGREGQLPKNAGEFHLLLSDNVPDFDDIDPPVTAIGPSAIFNPFSPAPLGNDLFVQFGDDFALPLFGNFDPPVSNHGGGGVRGSLTNLDNRFDTNRDGKVSALDALVVINAMSQERFDHLDLSTPLRAIASLGGFQLDASGDGSISALDALQVINELSRQSVTAVGEQVDWAASADSAIAELGDDDDDLLALLAADQEQQRVKT